MQKKDSTCEITSKQHGKSLQSSVFPNSGGGAAKPAYHALFDRSTKLGMHL